MSSICLQGDFGRGWSSVNSTDATEMATAPPEYLYKTADELDSYPYVAAHGVYGGGGYVFELRGPLRNMLARAAQLKKEGWVDRYTRAVFVEFTVYNAQVTETFRCCTRFIGTLSKIKILINFSN